MELIKCKKKVTFCSNVHIFHINSCLENFPREKWFEMSWGSKQKPILIIINYSWHSYGINEHENSKIYKKNKIKSKTKSRSTCFAIIECVIMLYT